MDLAGATRTRTYTAAFLYAFALQLLARASSTAAAAAAAAPAAAEARALLRWKSTLPPLEPLSSWSPTTAACSSWAGVTCGADGRIARVALPGAGLAGTLATLDLAAFPALADLNLSGNHLAGAIPAGISRLTSLVSLDLSNNALTGGIPPALGTLPALRVLVLRNNSLGGAIPASLGRLRTLERLDLQATQLVSTLPPEMGGMASLKFLDLSTNNLSGGLPPSFAGMRKMRQLYLSRNKLSGMIPPDIFKNWPDLTLLYLHYNSLAGTIPPEIGEAKKLRRLSLLSNNLTSVIPADIGGFLSLQMLHLGQNCLTGPIPTSLGNLTQLVILVLSFNNLTGTVPAEIGSLAALQELDLNSNQLEGELPATLSMLKDLSDLSLASNNFVGTVPNFTSQKLVSVELSGNNFTGGFPLSFCQLTSLEILDLSSNQLSGQLPSCIWDLQDLVFMDLSSNALSGDIQALASPNSNLSLESLHLANNRFTGGFPSIIQYLKMLSVLDLGGNNFSGAIPSWIGSRLPLLRFLRLRSNMFNGSIPLQLLQLSHLQLLDLASNNFDGHIPCGLTNLTSMIRPQTEFNMKSTVQHQIFHLEADFYYADRVDVNWKMKIYEFQGEIALLTGIDLSGNSIDGEIPTELTNLQGLRFLNLSRNHLSGTIPTNIGDLKLLESLDLSWNELSGHIPSGVSELISLSSLNFSNNMLSGEIPTGNQLQTLADDPSIYSNNFGLCGFPLSKCPSGSSKQILDRSKEFEGVYVYYSDLESGLYLVSTPIGNLEDITLRALRILKCANVILSEDTRHSGKLLQHYNIKTPLLSFHKFNEREREPSILRRLHEGEAVALISDAGTPGISDPGMELARLCAAEKIPVVPIPGPSAAIAALSVSGLPSNEFTFVGFLPKHARSRRDRLEISAREAATQIFYVPPHGIHQFLVDAASSFGDSRSCVIAREITKLHEEFWRGTLGEANEAFSTRQPKGEITVLIEGQSISADETPSEDFLEHELRELMAKGHTLSAAVKLITEATSAKKKDVYALALRLFGK